jgi:hypothetical protein
MVALSIIVVIAKTTKNNLKEQPMAAKAKLEKKCLTLLQLAEKF